MLAELRELFRYRELLLVLVGRDLKVRYKRSALGFLWSFINPLMQMVVITVIFKFVHKLPIKDFSVWVLAALLPWAFFQNSVLDAAQSILIHFSLLKKVYLPREIIPLTTVIANLVHLGLSLCVFFVYATFYPIYYERGLIVPPYWGWKLLLLPALIFLQFLLNTGVAFAISAMNVFYEDIKFIVTHFIQLLFYACPILYPTSKIIIEGNPAASDRLFFWYCMNPMASLIFAYQKVMLSHAEQADPRPLNVTVLSITAIQCVLIFLWGYRFFNRRKWEFAERL